MDNDNIIVHDVTAGDVETSHKPLNDVVINAYMDLIIKRSPETLYAFDTFFFNNLSNKGYESVSRWTKKVDIFSKEQLLIPVYREEENHWCLISVNLKEKSINYYDSIRRHNPKCLKQILLYLKKEYYNKKNRKFNVSGWEFKNEINYLENTNCWNDGVFVLKYADCFSRCLPLNFCLTDIVRLSKQIGLEIIYNKLLY